ncbi:hypothetical protein [Microbacterium aurum]
MSAAPSFPRRRLDPRRDTGGRDRVIRALTGVVVRVGEAGERLPRHRGGERLFAGRLCALGGDQRGQHAVVHEGRDGDALGLGGVGRGRRRVGVDRVAARPVDAEGDGAQHPRQRDHDPGEDHREHRVEDHGGRHGGGGVHLQEARGGVQHRDEHRPGDLQRHAEGHDGGDRRNVEQVPDPGLLGRVRPGIRPAPGGRDRPRDQGERQHDREQPRAHPHADPGRAGEDRERERGEHPDHEREVPRRALLGGAERVQERLDAQHGEAEGDDDADDPLDARLREALRTGGDVAEGPAHRRIDGDRRGFSGHRRRRRRP